MYVIMTHIIRLLCNIFSTYAIMTAYFIWHGLRKRVRRIEKWVKEEEKKQNQKGGKK